MARTPKHLERADELPALRDGFAGISVNFVPKSLGYSALL